jgi:hypothetical protein
MATATTQVTYDYSATGASRDAATTQIATLLQPYKDAGVITDIPNWTPSDPLSVDPEPTTGLFVATRLWQDATDAQTFVTAINSWLTANPTTYASQFTIE